MKANFRIRGCEKSESADVIQLWKAAAATPSVTDSIDELRKTIAGGHAIVLVAIDEQRRIVGSVIGGWDGWRGNIYRLAVAPEARRLGVAAALVREVSARLVREKGAHRISALVDQAHPDALEFWDSMASEGYAFDPRIVRYVKTV